MTRSIPQNALRDLVGNAPLNATARLTMAIADRIQREPNRGVRLAATLSAAQLAAERSGLSLFDCLSMTKNLMNHADGTRPELRPGQYNP